MAFDFINLFNVCEPEHADIKDIKRSLVKIIYN